MSDSEEKDETFADAFAKWTATPDYQSQLVAYALVDAMGTTHALALQAEERGLDALAERYLDNAEAYRLAYNLLRFRRMDD